MTSTGSDPRTDPGAAPAAAPARVAPDTGADELEQVCARALAAAPALDIMGRAGRARLLLSLADALEAHRGELVATAARETGLGEARLGGELTRTAFQLRSFAEVVTDGAHLGATVDHAGPTPMGPRPDLRRIAHPRGVAAVFGASNFPFAFSVPGGDTASALAAGCPVVAKVHEGHPATSLLCAQALREGAEAVGAPADVVQLVVGQEAGLALVRHPAVSAVGFTGSEHVGRLLFDAAQARPVPIPFHAEMGALNAVVVAPAAARRRAAAVAEGLAASAVLGTGQFCTKPGLALVPAGAAGDDLVRVLAERFAGAPATAMLTERTAEQFSERSSALAAAPGARVLATGPEADAPGPLHRSPVLLGAEADALEGVLLQECFGPALVVSRYRSDEHLVQVLERLGGALTGTVHADVEDAGDGAGDDAVLARRVLARFAATTGRVVWNGYPTGVAVSWAMHHGGPYPASTDAAATSVGAGAVQRWLRPVSYQDVPAALLPPELRDGDVDLPRRVDGVLVLPAVPAGGR